MFGGTGFLGRRIVRHLHDKGFSVRIASRRPSPSSGDDPQLRSIAADIHERPSIASAIAGALAWSMRSVSTLHAEKRPSMQFTWRQPSG